MKFLTLCLLLVGICLSGNASGAVVSSDVYGVAVSWGEDALVADGVVVAPNQINITRTMNIENRGTLQSNILVCDSCDLFVRNFGDVVSDFVLGTDSGIFHVISDEKDATPIDFGVGFTVLVDGATDLTLGQVANAALDADKVIITDSILSFDSGDVGVIDNVEINGEIKLKTANLADVYNRAVFTNVSGEGRVVFLTDDADVMFVNEGVVRNSNLYVQRRRETDYRKIFNDDVGEFINGLRSDGGACGLMQKLDAATDMNELHSVMASSVRFNSDLLQEVVRQIFVFDGVRGIDVGASVAAIPFVIASGDLYAYGIGANVVGRLSDAMSIGAMVRVGGVAFDNDIDAFRGKYYGGGVSGAYTGHDTFIRSAITVNSVAFDIGDVMYDGVVYHNPDVFYGDGVADVGYVFNVSDGLYFAPYVGIDAAIYSIADLTDMDVFVRGGAGIGYKFNMLGIQYNYGANLVVNTGGESVLMGRVGFWSEYDRAGGDIGIGIMHNNNTVAYKLSATVRLWF